MRPIYMILAGVAAFTLATPASAAWQDRTYSHQLQVQIRMQVPRQFGRKSKSSDLLL